MSRWHSGQFARTLLIAERDGVILDNALERVGLPRCGFRYHTPFRGATQVLKLCLALMWAPVNPHRMLQFLLHPTGPLPRWVRSRLADAVAASPGVGGPAWHHALERIEQALGERDETGDADIERLRSDIAFWLESERHDPRVGAPVDDVVARTQRVSNWAAARLNTAETAAEAELFAAARAQANPMQLALFMKLARFAREVIFVGDVKQAIYGFRGSDPELVHRTLDALRERGCSLDVLESSWRSRPPLVRYLNTVFAAAFERDNIDRALVELAPQRKEAHDAPAVVRWTLPKAKAAEQADALAGAIADLVESQLTVNDSETHETRAVGYGDVAVLAATNDHVEAIAGALRERRVPMKMTLSGLLDVPEVCLARACLRRLNDPSDTLASAEIRALGACEEPEHWLADRLRWLAAEHADRGWGDPSTRPPRRPTRSAGAVRTCGR